MATYNQADVQLMQFDGSTPVTDGTNDSSYTTRQAVATTGYPTVAAYLNTQDALGYELVFMDENTVITSNASATVSGTVTATTEASEKLLQAPTLITVADSTGTLAALMTAASTTLHADLKMLFLKPQADDLLYWNMSGAAIASETTGLKWPGGEDGFSLPIEKTNGDLIQLIAAAELVVQVIQVG